MPPLPVQVLALAALPLFIASCPQTPTVTAETPATFETVSQVFKSDCTTSSCHGSGAKGDLQLSSDMAYDQLVNKPASHNAAKAKGKIRVIPGDPENSFLMQKLTTPAADEGERMPERLSALPPETINLIRRWIAAGCPR